MQKGELVCIDKTGRYNPVFKKQGCLDGACATYSVVMNLLILGVIAEKDTQVNAQYKTKKAKKFFEVFCEGYGMHRYGQTYYKIKRMLKESLSTVVTTKHKLTSDKQSLTIIKETLDTRIPIIISIGDNSSDWGHAMLAIGYEENDGGEICKILCLDPGGDYIHGRKRWNAEIKITPKQYRLQTVWNGLSTTKIITLDDVLIITKNEEEA